MIARRYETIINQAELMAMAPGAVAEFLKERAGKAASWPEDPLDQDAEASLRSRGDPQIDFALARYGHHIKIVSEVFQSADPDSPIRLACLANRSLSGPNFPSFPVGLLGREPELMAKWLVTASENELDALFRNPTLDDDFLRELLERSGVYEAVSDNLLWRAIISLYFNPRMRTPWHEGFMDGYTEWRYGSVFGAAWKLAETAPATNAWAGVLGSLYDVLIIDGSPIEEALKVAERWRVDPADEEEVKSEADRLAHGRLGNKQTVRKGLARLALKRDHGLLGQLLSSEDVALRCGAYYAGWLTTAQLEAGFNLDGRLAFDELLGNLNLWRRRDTRQALHEIAWRIVRADESSDLGAANSYNWKDEYIRREHPTWFSEDEAALIDEDTLPATKGDLEILPDILKALSEVATKSEIDILTNKLPSRTLAETAQSNTLSEMALSRKALVNIEKSLETLRSDIRIMWWIGIIAVVAGFLNLAINNGPHQAYPDKTKPYVPSISEQRP